MRGGFLQPLLAVGHRTDLAGQADLAERHGLVRERPVAQARQHRQQHRQVGRGLLHADAADHVDEHVLVAHRHAAVPVQYRQQHGHAVAFQPDRDPARVGQRRRIDQRLHFHQQRAGALARDHHAAARLLRRAGQEDRRRIGHLAQALVAHREHAQLVDRAEAVLERAQHAEAAARVALEVQHGVDHVLEHARAGDAALLGHVADQEHRGAGFLGVAHQARGRFAHLADRTGRGGELLGPQGLHRIGHDQLRPQRRGLFEDALDSGLGQRAEAVERQVEPRGAAGDLRQRLLAGHVQAFQPRAGGRGRHLRQRLQQQRRLADARIAADQHHRAFDQAAAEHAVELADAGGHARILAMAHVLERGDLGRIDPPGPAPAPRRGRCLRPRRLQHDLRQRVPGPAFAALALPLVELRAAFAADVGGPGLGHLGSVCPYEAPSIAAAIRAGRDARADSPWHRRACAGRMVRRCTFAATGAGTFDANGASA